MFQNNSKSKGNPSKYVNNQSKNRNSNLASNERNSPKKKIARIGDSVMRYLKRKNLLSKNNEVKAAYPGSTKEDM